ncbi:hypothetical protein BGZ51_009569 [Haplosporangium sp. Z 767]|nr:hypothetical protein BGZ51_009569 [Haplosporangium sp. Z 767]
MPNSTTNVLIAGGGLGGLVLAILLQRAGINYLILEQSVLIRPIGSIIALSPQVLPLMEQLGLLNEIQSLALPCGGITFLRDDLSSLGKIAFNAKNMDHKERPDLYNILLSQIPKDRLKLGKRVVNFTYVQRHSHISQSSNSTSSVKHKSTSSVNVNSNNYSDQGEPDKIMVRCSDGTFFYGDILVGADGASSAVRQRLYRQLKKEGTLPKADQEEEQYRQVSLVGVTNSLNPKRYPNLNEDFSQFRVVLNKNSPFMSWFMPIPGNRYCWVVTRTLDEPVTITSGNSSYADWGPDATEEMSKAIRNLAGPEGGTVGDLVDSTDRHLISKVMLEQRVFKTWYGGRIVLIGDACHKSAPFTGKGANESMLDAVVLANLLYDTPSCFSNPADLQQVFKNYYQIRAPIAKQVVDTSHMFGSLLVKDGWAGDLLRRLTFVMAASWMAKPNVDKMYWFRMQASFLPLVPERGTIPGKPQTQSRNGLVRSGEYERDSDHVRVDEFVTGHHGSSWSL